jgi:hypothetical protein
MLLTLEEIRKAEAIERLEQKQRDSLPQSKLVIVKQNTPPPPAPSVKREARKQGRREQRKRVGRVESGEQGVMGLGNLNPCLLSSAPQPLPTSTTAGIEKNCEICLRSYHIPPSYRDRRRTCGDSKCVAKIRNLEKISKTCEICGNDFKVVASNVNRRRTCGKRECNRQIRSIARRRHKLWDEPKKCEHPDCPNMLEANRKKSKQEKYCSKRCASRDRHKLGLNPTR